MINISELVNLILDKTRDGRVVDWNERIAGVAVLAKIRPDLIDWQGSPYVVANRVVVHARNNDSLVLLEQVIT